MSLDQPRIFRDHKPKGNTSYENVELRELDEHPARALRNLSKLLSLTSVDATTTADINRVLHLISSSAAVTSRLEEKAVKGTYRTLWIPRDEQYQYILKRLARVFGSMSVSPLAGAFRKNIGPPKALRGLIDEYEDECIRKKVPLTRTVHSQNPAESTREVECDNHVIGTAYQYDLSNFYDTVTYDQIHEALEVKLSKLLGSKLDAEELEELVLLVCDLVCPGETLPQGFSTSPMIANFVAEHMYNDINRGVRSVLPGKAVSFQGYADDLTTLTSGAFSTRVLQVIGETVDRYGFQLNNKKTKFNRPKGSGTKKTSSGASMVDNNTRLEILGQVVTNNGAEPISFMPQQSMIHDAEEALRWTLNNMSPEEIEDQLKDPKAPIHRLLGTMQYIRDIIFWGTQNGRVLRAGKRPQTQLLPARLEGLWQVFLREKIKGKNKIKTRYSIPEENLDQPEEIDEITNFEYLNLVVEQVGLSIVQVEGGYKIYFDGSVLEDVTLEGLKNKDNIPENIEDLEDHLNGLEQKFSAGLAFIDSNSHPEDVEMFIAGLTATLAKWYLIIRDNILGLEVSDEENEFINIMDTDQYNYTLDDENNCVVLPQEGAEFKTVHPWGFENLLDGLSQIQGLPKGFISSFNKAIAGEETSKTRKGIAKFVRPQTKRNGNGGYLSLPEFGLTTLHGTPIVKKVSGKGKNRVTTVEYIEDRATEPFDEAVFRTTIIDSNQ